MICSSGLLFIYWYVGQDWKGDPVDGAFLEGSLVYTDRLFTGQYDINSVYFIILNLLFSILFHLLLYSIIIFLFICIVLFSSFYLFYLYFLMSQL